MTDHDRFARLLGKLLRYAYQQGFEVLVYQLYRDQATQEALYRQGKSKADGVRKRSKHQDGRAVDLAIVKDGQIDWTRCPEYDKLGVYWQTIGGTWGGNWKFAEDIYHFEV